jgi:NADPH2:quinone reductase
MRAVAVTEFGGPEALHVIDLPEEHAGPGQVRIRVTAFAVSPTDTNLRSGFYAERDAVKQPPFVAGMDAAGVLVEIGEGVETDLAVGDHVMAVVVPTGAHGAYREDLVLPARSIARVPAGVDDVAASTLPMNGLTAVLGLDSMALQPGQVLAVTGAAGAFGGYTIQLAKAAGLTVVADAKPEDEALVRSLGADVIVPRGDGFADAVRAQYPDGVDGLADGAVQDAVVLPAVKNGGPVVTVRGYTGNGERGLRFFPVRVATYSEEHEKLDALRVAVEEGVVTLRVADTFPAEQAAEAHRRLEAGGVRGRLVVTF